MATARNRLESIRFEMRAREITAAEVDRRGGESERRARDQQGVVDLCIILEQQQQQQQHGPCNVLPFSGLKKKNECRPSVGSSGHVMMPTAVGSVGRSIDRPSTSMNMIRYFYRLRHCHCCCCRRSGSGSG